MDIYTILVVDDDPGIVAALSLVLEGPYMVHAARSADQAAAILVERHVDVLITDYDLDFRGSGKALLDFAAARFPRVRRVLYSASPGVAVASAEVVVEKPDTLTLIKVVVRMIDGMSPLD